MELIFLYIAFATATTVVGYLSLIGPALDKLGILNPESEFVHSMLTRFQIVLVMEILLFLFAPVVIIILLNNKYSTTFIDSLAADLAKH